MGFRPWPEARMFPQVNATIQAPTGGPRPGA